MFPLGSDIIRLAIFEEVSRTFLGSTNEVCTISLLRTDPAMVTVVTDEIGELMLGYAPLSWDNDRTLLCGDRARRGP